MMRAYMFDALVVSDYLKQRALSGLIVVAFIVMGTEGLAVVPAVFISLYGIMGPMSAFAYDENNAWETTRLTLPVSRGQVVTARYLMAVTFTVSAFVFAMAIIGVLWVAGQVLPLPAGIAAMLELDGDGLVSIGLSACVTAFMAAVVTSVTLPLAFKMGNTKATQYAPFIICALMFVGAIAFANVVGSGALAAMQGVFDWLSQPVNLALTASGVLVLAAVLMAVSAGIARRFYATRDM